ncbi:MAG: tRNA pseudouridine(38-40) synthase TruA, partial [Deltaproteobacteria bacterium]|nr:tRNA pseudouridine(38-40) synthase TruA [Deltaproteobacteria bacterium]
ASFADRRFDKDASTHVKINGAEVLSFQNLIIFRISGSHFLWKMVRRIVGVLVEVGRGNLTLPDVERMLQQFSDVPAKWTAPPSGLFLMQVLYEGDREEPVRLPLILTP